MAVHAVIGGGPLGLATARALAEKGESVRLVSRTPKRESIDGVEPIATDATRVDELARALEVRLRSIIVRTRRTTAGRRNFPRSGTAYSKPQAGQGLVSSSENLYAFGRPSGRPLDASSALAPCSRKGSIRADLEREALAAHDRGEVQVALVRGVGLLRAWSTRIGVRGAIHRGGGFGETRVKVWKAGRAPQLRLPPRLRAGHGDDWSHRGPRRLRSQLDRAARRSAHDP